MEAIGILEQEHHLIRKYLENLSVAREKLESGEQVSMEFFTKAIEFARDFTDRFHHFKEEYVMFTRLAERHEGTLDAKIEALRNQHERGRTLIAAIQDALPGYEQGNPLKADDIQMTLASYISLLRGHIHREDNHFYPLVKATLTEDEQKALLPEFEKEASRQEGARENGEKLVSQMAKLLGD